MPWVRLDEGFARHPKVAVAGPLGIAMQVAGLCYCNQYLTDGFVPRHVVPNLLNLEGIGMKIWRGELAGGGEDATWELIVEDLTNAGLWYEVDGGYAIHDYLTYQPSKADVLAERKQKSEAGRLGGKKSAEARRAKTSPNEAGASAAGQAPAQAERQAESKPVPVPDSVNTSSFLPSNVDVHGDGRKEGKMTEAEQADQDRDHYGVPHNGRTPQDDLAAELGLANVLKDIPW